jgi:integrase
MNQRDSLNTDRALALRFAECSRQDSHRRGQPAQAPLESVGVPGAYSPHSFRATGVTLILEEGGTLEVAQRVAGHADRRPPSLITGAAKRSGSRIWNASGTERHRHIDWRPHGIIAVA